MHLGPGPVFFFECLTAARRWQRYAARALFGMALLVAMVVIWLAETESRAPTSARVLAEIGERYFYALIGTELALVMLAAPAFTAGAICVDRARGSLAHVLATDLTATEIVMGKLGAGLLPVFGLVACALPVMSLGALLGGMDPMAVGMAFLVALAVGLLSCTLALAISVSATRTHEALMAVYACWTLDLMVHPLWSVLSRSGVFFTGPPRWTLKLNPFWLAFSPYVAPNQVEWTDFAAFFGGALVLSTGLTVVSIVRLRPVSARLANGARPAQNVQPAFTLPARLRRLLPGPSLDGNPVLWREWHRNQPSRLTRLLWWAFFGGLACGGFAFVVDVCLNGVPRTPGPGVLILLLGIGLGLLLLSVTASTSLSEERTRGTLDVLLATPLSTRSIVWGKWWGAYRVVPLLAVWPTVAMAAFAFGRPTAGTTGFTREQVDIGLPFFVVLLMAMIVLTHGAALNSLGLALATWIPRPGRAAGLSVAAYVLVSVGYPILVLVLVEHGPRDDMRLADLSPIFASIHLCEDLTNHPEGLAWTCASITFWLHGVAGAAVFFYTATLATFNRCLGRSDDLRGGDAD